MLNWIKTSWFRHILTLRPTYSFCQTGTWWDGELGLPRLAYNFEPEFHFTYIGLFWNIGPFFLAVGLEDTN